MNTETNQTQNTQNTMSAVPTIEKIASSYKSVISFAAFFAMCLNTSNNLNKPSDRFAKGGLREKALESFSNGRLRWIDEEGRDNRDDVLGLDIEFKTTKLRTKTGKNKKYVAARLKNTMGDNATCAIKKPADVYMFGGCDGLVICDYKTLEPYLHMTKDALTCKIPFEKVTPIAFASDYDEEIKAKMTATKSVDYVAMRQKMEMEFLSRFV